ncbi:MAG: AAA family ATPase [Phycisphaerales bacterium]
MDDQMRFERLLSTRPACIRIVTLEEQEAADIVRQASAHAPSHGSPRAVLQWSVVRGMSDGVLESASVVPGTENAAAALTHLLLRDDDPIVIAFDLGPHLRDEATLRACREAIARLGQRGGCLVMIDAQSQVPAVLASYSTVFELSLPDSDELEGIVRSTLRRLNREKPIKAEMSKKELQLVVRNLRGLSRRQARVLITGTAAPDGQFTIYDLNTMLARKRQLLDSSGLLEYIKAPVDLDAIGGMYNLKRWLKRRDAADTEEARAFGIDPPRGVLILGVQGAGKSLSAKAIATAWRRPLLRMDVGMLYDRFVGESERRLRDALKQAEAMAPIVLWIDEIEKAFASASPESGASDGGLSRRMFGMLLTWMQEHRASVFLVATANDIAALPPELLRKGRFDEIFFVDLPGAKSRREILSFHLSKRGRQPASFDLDALVQASEGYTGAEIEQAIIAGLNTAFAEGADLTTQTLAKTLRESPPLSITMREQVEELRAWSVGRCVNAE